MDKDIHDINIEGEKIEGVVLDDNDTDALTDSQTEKIGEEKEAENVEGEEDSNTQEPKTEAAKDVEIDSADEESDVVSEVDYAAKRKKRLRNIKLALIIPAIAIIIAGMITLYIIAEQNEKYNNLLNVDYFYEGVYVDDISLGGLTYEEAKEKIENSNILRSEKVQIVLTWEDEEIVFGKDDVEISFDTGEILEKAWREGREGTEKERYDHVLSIIENPIYFNTALTVDPSRLESKVKAVAMFRQRDPGEAFVQFNPDPETEGSEWFVYSEPEKGVETDPDALWKSVQSLLKEQASVMIEIPKSEVEPTTTLEDLKNITQPILKEPFKTSMVRNENREHNVRLACSMINGTVLMPGEIFSMNETTGERTEEAGFKKANVIVGGNRLEPGIAGGVCQVSGTLFNAAVRADLEIVERYHHSFELGYLTRGRDATVNYGTADLRFKNTTDYPIYISMYTIDRVVYAQIYGEPLADGMTIELYVKTTQTVNPGPTIFVADSTVTYGQTEVYGAHTGIKCTTYKDYYDADGKLIERVELHRDYYRAFPREVHYHPAAGRPAG